MSRIKSMYDDVQASIVITSDNHIDKKHPFPFIPMWYLCRSLKDAQDAKTPTDAYITVGDTTSRGNEINWELARKCFKKYQPAKKIMLTIGNHDTWNDDGFEPAREQYLKSLKEICGRESDKTYFTDEVSGCKLIFLGSDADSGCEASFSEEEISWFENEMATARGDRPVFVFCHQSLNGRHGLPRTWEEKEKPDRKPMEGGIGVQSDKIAEILKSRKNVFYFSGHSHMGLCGEKMKQKEGYASFESEDGVELINLPSLACKNHHGENNGMGIGVVLEVYSDRIVIRPRCFSRRCMNKNVLLRDGKPYLIKEIELHDRD